MKLLGISAWYHDSAACLLQEGRIVAAVQEERFSRQKHDPRFPADSIRYCLETTGLSLDELDAVVFYEKPFLKFERLLESYYGFAPRGLPSFIKAMPIWIKEKLFLKDTLKKSLRKLGPFDPRQTKLLFPSHHLSHAASAFYPSPFESAAIVTLDGVGEWETASIGFGEGSQIRQLKSLSFPHSLGLLYSAFTYFLGFRVNNGEYKLMGLAPYGEHGGKRVARFVDLIKTQLIHIYPDGGIWLNQKYFRYATSLRMIRDKDWENLFGMPRRNADIEPTLAHADLALAIQQVCEEVILKLAATAKALTGARHLCLAGGVALNSVANGKLLASGLFDEVFIQPAAGDAGGSLGAALAAHHIYFHQPRQVQQPDAMQGARLGPAYSSAYIQAWAQGKKLSYELLSWEELPKRVAALIAAGKVIGWFQGRMEFGPRALGQRSILADPRQVNMQRTLNLNIKYRESFRPFAPVVQAEEVDRYFELNRPSPYMLLVRPVQAAHRLALPDDYPQGTPAEKLAQPRSAFPAITHVDFSARIQTVDRQQQALFWQLLEAMKSETGHGMLINTSFNVRGEPIVCHPNDALHCFLHTEMDYLVMENCLFAKTTNDSHLTPQSDNS